TPTAAPPVTGIDATPAASGKARRRRKLPVTQRMPSPKRISAPEGVRVGPAKNVTVACVTPLAWIESVSLLNLGAPVAARSAPSGSNEFAQPCPRAPALPHG